MNKRVTCSLCKKQGHNIRGCKVPKKIASQCIYYYKKAITFSLLSYGTDITDTFLETFNIDKLDSLIQIIKKKQCLYDTLISNVSYIDNLNDNSFKALTIYYDLNRFKIPKDDMCKILNTVISVKADNDLIYAYDLQFDRCVEYTKKTLEYENILTKMSDDTKNIISLHSIDIENGKISFAQNIIRINRLRILRYINTDTIYKIDSELQKQHRQIRNFSNEIDDLLDRIEIINRNIRDNINEREILIENKILFNDINNKLASIKIIHSDNITITLDDNQCPICYNDYNNNNHVRLNCGHTFCNKCLIKCIVDKYIELKQKSNLHIINSFDNICSCAMCRRPIFSIEGNEEKLNEHICQISESKNIENINYVIS